MMSYKKKKNIVGLVNALEFTFCAGLLHEIKDSGDPVFYSEYILFSV